MQIYFNNTLGYGTWLNIMHSLLLTSSFVYGYAIQIEYLKLMQNNRAYRK